jgi:hypothetical protein
MVVLLNRLNRHNENFGTFWDKIVDDRLVLERAASRGCETSEAKWWSCSTWMNHLIGSLSTRWAIPPASHCP